MLTFLISIIVVFIISLCFYKKKFWENKEIILLIGGGVALVAILTVNFATRNTLDTKITTISKHSIQVMTLNDSLVDDTFFSMGGGELNFTDHLIDNDSLVNQKYGRHLFYYVENNLVIGFAIDDELHRKYWDDIYILQSENDSIGYLTKERKYYVAKGNKWVTELSLPHIKTTRCLYLPESEFVMVPDSLIRAHPFI